MQQSNTIIQDQAAAQQLLLNLYLRERQDWYFLDIVPQHDPALKQYMLDNEENKFIRINLKRQEKVLFIPLRYYSLCGMHEAGAVAAIQHGPQEMLERTDLRTCLQLLLSELSDDPSPTGRLLSDLPGNYRQLLQAGERQEPVNTAQKVSASFLLPETKAASCLPVSLFCDECNLPGAGFEAKVWIDRYALAAGIDPQTAVTSWFRRYFELVLGAVLQLYYSGHTLATANYCHTYFEPSPDGLPVKVYFAASALSPLSPSPLTPGRQQEYENHILLNTFSLHLYCLIRNAGRQGLLQEQLLLELLHDTLSELRSLYPEAGFLSYQKRIPVPCCLEQLTEDQTDRPYLKKAVLVHNHIINVPHYSATLIKPEPGRVLHRRYFENGELELSLRAFDIEQDLPLFHDWVNRDYAKKFWQMDGPIQGLEREYIKHLGVDYSHPYVGMLNQTPFCTIELYWTPKDEVGKYYPFHPGDYGFHMLVAPAERRIRNLSTYILATAMEYFFSFPQVHRMIGEADADHQGTHNLITKVGCEFDRALELPYKTSNLTFCNRQQFRNATQELFRNSKQTLNIVNY